MRNILLNVFLLSMLLTGYAYGTFTMTKDGLTIECPEAKRRLPSEPKTDFTIKCSTSGGNLDDIIVGKIIVYGKVDQKTFIGPDLTERADGLPYAVYNGTDGLEPKLAELAPGRYSVKKDDTSVAVTVENAEPEDSGVWVCGTRSMTAEDYENAIQCNILVVGGVQNISFYNPDNGGKYESLLEIESSETSVPVRIEIDMSNVAADEIEIYANGNDVTKDYQRTTSGHTTVNDGGLVKSNETIKYEGTYQVEEGTSGEVRVKVHMDPLGGITTKILHIASKGKPSDVTCTFRRDGNGAVLTCEAKMFPTGNVTWETPLGEKVVVSDQVVEKDGATYENEFVDEVIVRATLTIAVWEDTYSDETFKVTFKNEYGETSSDYKQNTSQTGSGVNTLATLPLVVFLVLMTYFMH